MKRKMGEIIIAAVTSTIVSVICCNISSKVTFHIIDKLQERYGDMANLPKNCEYCGNFIQHYVKCGTVYVATCDGHCVAGSRFKSRKAGETCKYFTQKEYGRNYL